METSKFNFKEFNYLSDFNFPVACNDLCFSSSNKKLLAVGVYKPAVKLFDLKSSIMKYERHLICNPLKVISLEENAEKFVILRSSKSIEFHITGGLYETVKMPAQPHSIVFNSIDAELYLGGNFNEIFRFNLEQGRFLNSIPSKGVKNISFCPANGIICTTNNREISFFDSRAKSAIYTRIMEDNILCSDISGNGLRYCIGTEDGKFIEYDYRSADPQRIISNLDYPNILRYNDKNILLACNESLLVLGENDNEFEEVFSGFTINTFSCNGGIVFVGGEIPEIKGFYSDKFGQLPSWFADVKSI